MSGEPSPQLQRTRTIRSPSGSLPAGVTKALSRSKIVAGCPNGVRDGSHYFAATLDEHNANIARANEECAGV